MAGPFTRLRRESKADIAVDANLSAAAQDAITKKHTQDSDTALGTVGTKDPPIDADKTIYRNSAASDALVTSTWTQIKAFLKTYWDTLYAGKGANSDITSTTALTQITRPTGGAFDIAIGGAAGDDLTVATNKLVVEGDTGNVGVGTTVFGTSAAKVLGMGNCTKPTSFPADMFQMGPFDQAAGNACPHFWTELGKEIKLYQQAHIVDADGTLADITTKFNTLLTYMENLGFNATT